MSAFNYTALDKQGNEISGVIEAESLRDVRQKLRDLGHMPISVAPVYDKRSKADGGAHAKLKLPRATTVLLIRQIATMLASGLPVTDSIQSVAAQTKNKAAKTVLIAIRAKVLDGHTLASGFALFPNIFTSMFVATIAAGENSGHLDTIFERLADYAERQQEIRQKMTQALIYPLVMLFVSLGIISFLLYYVVPQLVQLFEHSDTALPLLTQIMIALSQFIKQFGILLLLLLLVSIYTFNWAMHKYPVFRARVHAVLLKLPLIQHVIQVVDTARYARTFGILSAAGLPILEAMSESAAVVNNVLIKQSLILAVAKVREGTSLSQALKSTNYFPAMSLNLIASGESSGRLDDMLAKAAETQEKEVTMLVNSAMTLFEPLMTLFMGGMVMLIVLSVMLPIFSISQTIR